MEFVVNKCHVHNHKHKLVISLLVFLHLIFLDEDYEANDDTEDLKVIEQRKKTWRKELNSTKWHK